MARVILHVDLDAFFCSVERLRNPDLESRPFVVGGRPEARGVVSSASYPAREYGVRSAMPTAEALRLCPQLLVLAPDHRHYQEYSRRVMGHLRSASPRVEQLSIDEAFLDVSEAQEEGQVIAARLQLEIEERFALPTSWGVASNKLVAKIASEVGKPRGLVVVPAGEEAAFLAPMPVRALWGVGPKTSERLSEIEVELVGQLASMPEQSLQSIFGVRGPELAARARGEDERPVEADHTRRSLSSEHTFPEDIADGEELHRTLLRMVEEIAARLRREELSGGTVRIKLRWPDFTTITRQCMLRQPTDQDQEILEAAMELFHDAWREGRKVRLLGVGVADLIPQVRQLELFDRTWDRDRRLLEAVDEIRRKYGRNSLRRAGTLPQDKD